MKVNIIEPTIIRTHRRTRVAAYARVSVEKEMMEHSLQAQVEHYTSRIDSNRTWSNAGVYADYGITGTKTDRPGFMRMMAECDAGNIDIILTKSISRFCRNTVDLLNTVRHLKDIGIEVVFEKEGIMTLSSDGELLLSLLASFAQEESRSMSENCRWAIRKRFEQGIGNWYHLYGYRYGKDGFVVVPEEAEVVRRVFSLYLDGCSPHRIARELNESSIRRRDGGLFTYNRVFKMLRQIKYTGNSYLQKTYRENHLTKRRMENRGQLPMFYATDTHPAIISEQMFEDVQEKIEARREMGYKANGTTNFSCFSGLIRCACCGRGLRRRKKGGGCPTHFYKCSTRIDGGSAACPTSDLPERVLFSAVALFSSSEDMDRFVEGNVESIQVFQGNNMEIKLNDGTRFSRHWRYDFHAKEYVTEDTWPDQ